MTSLHDERRDYLQSSLRRDELDSDPFNQFKSWFDKTMQDEGQIDATCMQVATVSPDGQPRCRIVLLKEFSDQGFVFFTSYASQKGIDIESNDRVGLSFAWNRQERQVHIEGVASKVSAEESDRYFYSRPLDSQRAACLATQSSTVENKEVLLSRFEQLQSEETVPRPSEWGGYIVKPTRFEFWQGGPARIHDRFVFEHIADEWVVKRVAP